MKSEYHMDIAFLLDSCLMSMQLLCKLHEHICTINATFNMLHSCLYGMGTWRGRSMHHFQTSLSHNSEVKPDLQYSEHHCNTVLHASQQLATAPVACVAECIQRYCLISGLLFTICRPHPVVMQP
mmetsp:Transcript_51927/g.86538  ORF Transcript_51927/g.86538 Transcript_51927/m.86538 type:complete len:125 (+) Transcript_51927:393-767(+)